MEHCKPNHPSNGPVCTFNAETGKWHTELPHPAITWRERARDRSREPKTKTAKPSSKTKRQRQKKRAVLPCSVNPSSNGEKNTGTTSHLVPEQSPTPPTEAIILPPAPIESAHTPTIQEHRCPCLICDLGLTGTKLVEMEETEGRLMHDQSPPQVENAQPSLHRMQHRSIWPDNFYINRGLY